MRDCHACLGFGQCGSVGRESSGKKIPAAARMDAIIVLDFFDTHAPKEVGVCPTNKLLASKQDFSDYTARFSHFKAHDGLHFVIERTPRFIARHP
jgi:hypothetical protein